jgi:UDP-hydrolysing UDP-N-acetyl-D-glucosamine 2-epimerase
MKREICIITGSRAEYGLLKPLMDEISQDPQLQLRLVVTGMHLSENFGITYHDIERDGFIIDRKIDIDLFQDTAGGIARSMGICLSRMAQEYQSLTPDIIVVLGDRFEIHSAVTAAVISKIPVAHIHGGELTEGAFDDVFRHSITKMSHLHFTATEEYRRRVVQMGESPDRVFHVGALGIDNIRNMKLLSKEELERELGFKFAKRNVLVTYHPETLNSKEAEEQFQPLLNVLDELEETHVIFTKANADPGGRTINRMIDQYTQGRVNGAKAFMSLGSVKYLSVLKNVNAVVGNSSSGIIEAPSLKVGTINCGDRQKGRIRAASVIDCRNTREDIKKGFDTLFSETFQKQLQNIKNPYGDGGTARKIKDILKIWNLKRLIKKSFNDIHFEG